MKNLNQEWDFSCIDLLFDTGINENYDVNVWWKAIQKSKENINMKSNQLVRDKARFAIHKKTQNNPRFPFIMDSPVMSNLSSSRSPDAQSIPGTAGLSDTDDDATSSDSNTEKYLLDCMG